MITTRTADDLPSLRALRAELHRHHAALPLPAGFRPRDEEDAVDGWVARADALLRHGTAELFVHTEGKDAAADGLALVCLRTAAELMRPVLAPVGGHAELVTLVVAAAARGRGVGTELHTVAADWARARGAGAMHIETRAANVDARRFYEGQGAAAAFTTLVQPLSTSVTSSPWPSSTRRR